MTKGLLVANEAKEGDGRTGNDVLESREDKAVIGNNNTTGVIDHRGNRCRDTSSFHNEKDAFWTLSFQIIADVERDCRLKLGVEGSSTG